MSGRTTRRRALIAGMTVSLAACVGGAGTAAPAAAPTPSPSPSPASSPTMPAPSTLGGIVDTRFVRAHDHTGAYDEGWYVETTIVDHVPAMFEWVIFTADWHDHRFGLAGDDPEPTPEQPSLRVVREPGRLSMWNPAFEEDCGTPWVDIAADAGMGDLSEAWPIETEAPPIKPLAMLEPDRNQAREVAPGVFALQVRVGDALAAANDHAGTLGFEGLLEQHVEAKVVTDLGRGWIELITVDLTDVLRQATGETSRLVLTWELGIGDLSIPWDPPPVDVAHPDCIREGHEV